ncbi:unnamed protein product [Adineta ricciae]|uniref:SS18 N-terminal domain-containing protein n=1 Tax=Adineta ricciae TaxID=249248 RepID=A0A814QSF6_ADIRI|nr:unnamed protein product [Adineta ricciae]CAF1388005.1 unnamed protein product [Adineta ricciae]
MSKIFLTDPQTGKTYPGDEHTVTNLLRENAALIRTIKELQNDGNDDHLFDYMKQLHRNIVWLSSTTDESSTRTTQ